MIVNAFLRDRIGAQNFIVEIVNVIVKYTYLI